MKQMTPRRSHAAVLIVTRIAFLTFTVASNLLAQSSDEANLNIKAIQPDQPSRSLADLLAMPPEALERVDIAEMQLLCFQDPSGAKTDVAKMLKEVGQKAEEAKKQAVAKKAGTAGERATALVSSLRGNSIAGIPSPILYLSVGRRLGYPVKLAVDETGGMSIFWDEKADNFAINLRETEIERIGHIPPRSVQHGQHHYYFLKPADELAFLLAWRGEALENQGLNSDALIAYTQAYLLSPGCRNFLENIRSVSPKVSRFFGHTSPKPAPDYSRQIDPAAATNNAARQITQLALAEANEIQEAQKQYRADSASRTKATNAIRIKYSQMRSEVTFQQNNKLAQEKLPGPTESKR